MSSRQSYQKGSLVKQRRADGSRQWLLRYRVTLADGRRVQRQAVVGSTEDYRTAVQAQKAAGLLRLNINNGNSTAQIPTVGEVSQHFKEVELCAGNLRRSWATKQNYSEILKLYIEPRWGKMRIVDVRAVEVEQWLGELTPARKKTPLSDATKQRIRNVFSVMFTHAQRYEFVQQGQNPIQLVRQCGKRRRTPDILTAVEVQSLWTKSSLRERAIIALEFGNGLRISEAIGLQWSDLDFEKGTASVTKTVVKGRTGKTKTEVSRKLVPLHPSQVEDLKAWREVAPYTGSGDWIFASHLKKGRKPYWPDMLKKRHLQPLALKLGIHKNIGWHTFRRTYASLLAASGADVKVVQELMRHANVSTTMNLYAQAYSLDARTAQGKVVDMVVRAEQDAAIATPEFDIPLIVR